MTSKTTRAILVCVLLTMPGATFAACSITAGESRCVRPGAQTGLDGATDQSQISVARFVSAPVRAVAPHRDGFIRPTRSALPVQPTFQPGDTLPQDITILLNRERAGLPPPQDGWTYFRLGEEVFRADLHSRRVIDRVNDHMPIRF